MNEPRTLSSTAPAPGGELDLLNGLFARLRRLHRGGVRRLSAVRSLSCALTLALLLVLLDAAVPLPEGVRIGADWLVPAAIALAALATWRRETRAQSLDRYVARRLESGLAPLQNDLINALEFGERLAAPSAETKPGELTGDLMQRSIRRALDESETPPRRVLRPAALRREALLLLGIAAMALVLPIAFSDVFMAVVPRFLDPRGDHPPYNPTRFRVLPEGAEVDYNSRLVIKATTSGVPARDAQLVLEDSAGRELNRLPMFQEGDDSRTSSFFQTVENIRDPMRFYIAAAGGRSRRYDLTLNKTPRIESVSLRLRPPKYAHLPEQLRLLSEPRIKGYARSTARITVASNRPLAGGELRVAGETVVLAPDGPNAVSGELTLASPGELTLEVKDVDGRPNSERWTGRVEIIPDNKPAISIVSPGMDSFAIPDSEIPLIIEASDDLGIKNVALVRNVNGSMDFRKQEYQGEGAENFVHAVENLDLADLGARPGDVISYYAMAGDSDPDGSKTAVSPIYRISVISFQEYRSYTQQQTSALDLARKYAEYEQRLQDLANRQEELRKEGAAQQSRLDQGEPLDAAGKAALADAQRRQQELEKQARELADDLQRDAKQPPIFDIEKSFKSELAKTADQVASATARMQAAAAPLGQAAQAQQSGAPPDRSSQALAQAGAEQQAALDALKRTAGQYGDGVEAAAQSLAKTAALLADIEQFKYLYQRQEALERQARLYKDSANPGLDDRVRLKELAEEQNDVRQSLERLKDDLRRHADAVGDDPPKVAEDARRIAGEIEKRGIAPLMQQAGDQFGRADGPAAQPPASLALEQMKQMIAFCESSGGAGGEMEQRLTISMSGRGMSMGATMEQLREGMRAGQGRAGANGQGSGGTNGSASQFAMFGSEHFGVPARESKIAGAHSRSQSAPEASRPALATTMEEIAPAAGVREVQSHGGERVMEEYRAMIDAYFKGLASEP